MNIEQACINDISELCKLLNYLFEQEADFTPNIEKQTLGLKLIIENERIGHILVAKHDKVIIGMVNILYSVSTALGSKVAIVEDMVVHPDYRNSGAGSKLLNYACGFAKEQGCLRVTLLTDIDNVNAQRFYKKHGFVQSAMTPYRRVL